mmetsp:Transcript_100734/g.300475  ORF Transcript_100734/g.300475 Transcript_100734/m.300475 type:complete len:240 (-) Transcript_100734:403-1122(-)
MRLDPAARHAALAQRGERRQCQLRRLVRLGRQQAEAVDEFCQLREGAGALQLAEPPCQGRAEAPMDKPWVVVIEADQHAEGAHQVPRRQRPQQPRELEHHARDRAGVRAPQVFWQFDIEARQTVEEGQTLKCAEALNALGHLSAQRVDQLCVVHGCFCKTAAKTCQVGRFKIIEIRRKGICDQCKQFRVLNWHSCVSIRYAHKVSWPEFLDTLNNHWNQGVHELRVKCSDAPEGHRKPS